jgi:hypothetical protein
VYAPTAKQNELLMQATPLSPTPPLESGGIGLGTNDHAFEELFHISVSG